jgi:hypothetical protein
MFVRLRIMFLEHSVCIKLETNNKNKNNRDLHRSLIHLRFPTQDKLGKRQEWRSACRFPQYLEQVEELLVNY